MRPHGTAAKYVQGCRPDRADAHDVRAHIDWLRANGMGVWAISRAADVSRSAINDLYRSRRTGRRAAYVKYEVARRLLAVDFDLAAGQMVSAVGTHRRVHALVAIGWSQAQIAARCGISRTNWTRMMSREYVRKATAARVAAVYDELWDQLPPQETSQQRGSVTRALNDARKHGWVPPLAWDDDEIDDPQATPHTPRREGAPNGRSLEQLVEDWHDTWDHHQGDTDIAAGRLGIQAVYLRSQLQRARAAGMDAKSPRSA